MPQHSSAKGLNGETSNIIQPGGHRRLSCEARERGHTTTPPSFVEGPIHPEKPLVSYQSLPAIRDNHHHRPVLSLCRPSGHALILAVWGPLIVHHNSTSELMPTCCTVQRRSPASPLDQDLGRYRPLSVSFSVCALFLLFLKSGSIPLLSLPSLQLSWPSHPLCASPALSFLTSKITTFVSSLVIPNTSFSWLARGFHSFAGY